jgi:hypothetical protein
MSSTEGSRSCGMAAEMLLYDLMTEIALLKDVR